MFEDIEYFLSQAEAKGINVSALRARIATLTRETMETFVGELQEGPSLSGLIVAKQSEQRVVLGPVLVPGEPDSEGEVLTAKKIEETAYEFLEKFRHVDVEHTLKGVGRPVSSDLLRFEETYNVDGEELVLPQGTWMLGVRVEDDETWAAVKSGQMRGFSIMGVPRDKLEQAMATKTSGLHWDNGVLRKTLLSDLGPDWVTVAVSILERPSVKKSMFVAVKEGANWLDRLRHRLSIKGDANQNKEDEKLNDEDKKEVGEMISAAIKEAVPDIVTAVKEQATPKPEPPETVEESEEVTALKTRLETLEGENKKLTADFDKINEFFESATKSQALSSAGDGGVKPDERYPAIVRDLTGRRMG